MRGLFVGLATLDVIQLVGKLPNPDQKIRAHDFTISAGGPATNAAVAFAHKFPTLHSPFDQDSEATLVTRISSDPVGEFIHADLQTHNVDVKALSLPPGVTSTVASILVTKGTGDRAVVSAGDKRPSSVSNESLDINVESFDVVETDGYETDVTLTVLKEAKAAGVPTILDGGSIKSYTESLLPYIDIAIVSELFAEGRTPAELFDYIGQFGVKFAAITRGKKPIDFYANGETGSLEPEKVTTVDTLGAGDFFHGAFARAIAQKSLTPENFVGALSDAARVASLSVQSFGTRNWLTSYGAIG